MSYRLIAAASVAVLALQACAPKPSQPNVAADDLNDGVAKTCSYSPVQPKSGATVDATITMTNDGWCAFRASEKQGTAYMLGLVKQRPAHGELQIRKWAGESRLEYTAHPGFTGTDKFSAALRPQDGGADAIVQVAATVSRGEGAPAVSAPAADDEKPTPTKKPARRRATSRSTRQ